MYGCLLPALRLMPPPADDQPARQPRLVGAHLVYGVVLAQLCDRSGTRGQPAR